MYNNNVDDGSGDDRSKNYQVLTCALLQNGRLQMALSSPHTSCFFLSHFVSFHRITYNILFVTSSSPIRLLVFHSEWRKWVPLQVFASLSVFPFRFGKCNFCFSFLVPRKRQIE